MCHQNKSDLKALFSLIVMQCSFLNCVVVKYISETKVLTGLTTSIVCHNIMCQPVNISFRGLFSWEPGFYDLLHLGKLIYWQSDLHTTGVKYDIKEE